MPKYEYACKSCGEHFDVTQSFTDNALTECPTCSGVLRKVFHSPGIVLRGPGFYRTDHRSPYRPDGNRPPEKERDKESAQSSSDKSSDSKSSDSKGSDSKGSDSKGSDSKSESKGGSKDSGRSESGRSGDIGGSSSSSASKDAARTA